MMTLGGLAAGIGLFIDDAIVMIEAMHRAHAGGAGIQAAMQNGAGRADSPAGSLRPQRLSSCSCRWCSSPASPESSFALWLYPGCSGLAVSLILALFFTPALEMLVERWRGAGREPGRVFGLIQRVYVLGLKPFLRLPVFALIVAAGSLILATMLYRTIGTDYLPELDEGAFTLDYTTPPESTLDDTQGLLARIEDVIKSTPEVAAFSRRTGTQLGFFLTESNRGDISVLLKSKRTRDIDEIMDSILSAASRRRCPACASNSPRCYRILSATFPALRNRSKSRSSARIRPLSRPSLAKSPSGSARFLVWSTRSTDWSRAIRRKKC